MNKATTPSKTPNSLPIAAPKAVFITGANGFIGRALAARYRALGAEVRGMDLNADLKNGIVAGNLTEPKTWAKHAKGCDLFINTAAVVSTNAPWKLYRDVTIKGVRNSLDVAIAGGAKRFVHYSTVATLGFEDEGELDEKTPVIIGEDYRYGVSKGASEHVVLAAHAAGEINCTIVRPGDVYGPGSRAWLVVPLEMCRKGMMTLPAHGEGRFSPVYIDDLLDGTMLAAGLDAGSGHIFHISGGYSISCKEFFTYHWHWAGRSGSPRCVSTPVAIALTGAIQRVNQFLGRQDETGPDAMHMLARKGGYSIAKAKKLLGFAPKTDFATGIKKSEAWLREIGEIK